VLRTPFMASSTIYWANGRHVRHRLCQSKYGSTIGYSTKATVGVALSKSAAGFANATPPCDPAPSLLYLRHSDSKAIGAIWRQQTIHTALIVREEMLDRLVQREYSASSLGFRPPISILSGKIPSVRLRHSRDWDCGRNGREEALYFL
jgi:hypothetical protein